MWAEKAYPPLVAAVQARVGPAAVKDASPLVCIERPALGPLGILRRGRDLVIVAGPVKVVPNGPWTSAADCAATKKWMIEIAANK
jgi:hypothetical protein